MILDQMFMFQDYLDWACARRVNPAATSGRKASGLGGKVAEPPKEPMSAEVP